MPVASIMHVRARWQFRWWGAHRRASQVPPCLWSNDDGCVRVLEQHPPADKYAHLLFRWHYIDWLFATVLVSVRIMSLRPYLARDHSIDPFEYVRDYQRRCYSRGIVSSSYPVMIPLNFCTRLCSVEPS